MRATTAVVTETERALVARAMAAVAAEAAEAAADR
jgi:hypothetical protein